MEPISLLIILVCIWSLLHFWLLPLSKDRWIAADMRTKLVKSGSLVVLEKIRDLTAVGAVATTVVILMVWGAGQIAVVPINVPKTLIESMASTYSSIKDFADGYGIMLTVFGVFGASYSLFRCTRYARRRVSEMWSAAAQEVYTHLRENPAEIEVAHADEDLRPLVQHFDTLLDKLNRQELEKAISPNNQAAANLRERTREELSSALSALSIEIAKKKVGIDAPFAPYTADRNVTTDRGQLLVRMLTGERFCKDIGLIKRPLTYVVTGLLFVTLIGWAADPLATSLQLVVNNLRVNVFAQEARHDLDSALSQAEPNAADIPLAVLQSANRVQVASSLMAHAAVREMLRSSLIDHVIRTERTVLSETEFARAAINEQSYETPVLPEVPDVVSEVRKEVVQNIGRPPLAGKHLQVAEQQIALMLQPSIQELDHKNPSRLDRIVEQLQARYATPMAPLDAQGELLGDMIDEAFSATNLHSSSEVTKQAEKLLKEFGKKAVTKWAQAFTQHYVAQAIFDTARPDVWAHAQDKFRFETSEDMRRFIAALNGAEGSGLRIVASDEEALMDHNVATYFAKNATEPYQALVNRLSGYESIFPSHDNGTPLPVTNQTEQLSAPHSAKVGDSKYSANHSTERVDPLSENFGQMRSFTQARAKSFPLASLSFRVRGVLIGWENESTGLDITDLRWSMHPATGSQVTRATLQARFGTNWQTLGTFDAGVINQALRYAADGRVVATTITGGVRPLLRRLTYLHPALVDTPLGCRIVEADRIIDTFSAPRDSRPMSPALAELTSDRLNAPEWMGLLDLAEKIARIPAGTDCPQAELEQVFKTQELQPPRFSTALNASIMHFMNEQEKKMPGSTKFLRTATACSMGPPDKLASCLCTNVKPEGLPSEYWFPEDHTSQLRERKVLQKPDLRWLQTSDDGLQNFDLWVHITFALRKNNDNQPDEESATAVDFPIDELNKLRQFVIDALPRYLSQQERSPSYKDFMAPLEEFVIVQRFARSALAGTLGHNFPVSRLIDLARDTRQYVPFQRTVRWEPTNEPADLASALQQADARAADVYKSWANDQRERMRQDKPICDRVSR